MIISLIGYMGSGKSHISKVLSQKLNLKLFEVNTYPGSNFLDIEDSIVRVQYYQSFNK